VGLFRGTREIRGNFQIRPFKRLEEGLILAYQKKEGQPSPREKNFGSPGRLESTTKKGVQRRGGSCLVFTLTAGYRDRGGRGVGVERNAYAKGE